MDKMNKWADSKNEELQQLLFDLCRIPSPSGLEDKRAMFCKAWLEKHGAEGVYIDEAKNVIFPYCDNGEEVTVFCAHTDTVFPDSEPFDIKIEGDKATCPGIGDDTANVTQLMMSISYILENKLKAQNGGLIFVLNSCEEGLGNLKGTRAVMAKYGNRCKEFYSFDLQIGRIVNNAVGSRRFKIEVKTEGGHSYNAFGNPNAINQLAEIIVSLGKIKIPEKENTKTTMNVGTVSGGTSVNTIAQHAEMLFEFRSDDLECIDNMQKQFDEIIEAEKANGKDLSVTVVGERPCMGNVDPEKHRRIIEKCKAINRKYTGKEPQLYALSTDCNIPLSMGIPATCFGGIIGEGAHTREEYIMLSSLVPGLKAITECIMLSM